MGSGGVRPHPVVWNPALYGPELARSKMGYEANTIRHIVVFRGGCGPLWRLAQPPGPRRTSDQFHPPRKTLLSLDNIFFDSPIFNFPQTLKKDAFMAKTEISALQRAISTGSRPRRKPKVLPFDPQGDSRQIHVFRGHVTFCPKPIIQKIQKMFPVKYHTKRISVRNKFIRHREPSQNTNL